DWRTTYGVLAVVSLLICLILSFSLPAALQGRPLSLASFGTIARNATIVLILLVSLLTTSGQFTIVIYMAPLTEKLTGQGPAVAGLFLAILGGLGLIGNIVATSVVPRLGVQKTLAIFLSFVTSGLLVWAAGAGVIVAMGVGIALLGLGFA